MAYRKNPPRSRKYKKSESHIEDHKSNAHNQSDEKEQEDEHDIPHVEPDNLREKKKPQAFGFLTSLFGAGEKTERTGDPLFTVLDHDIYLDDLLLVGLILLLMTDTIEDEILLIILAYLLLDIF